VFLEPPAAFTSHVSHGVTVFLRDRTARHPWNIAVVSAMKYPVSHTYKDARTRSEMTMHAKTQWLITLREYIQPL
jgi:hypothetical protein